MTVDVTPGVGRGTNRQMWCTRKLSEVCTLINGRAYKKDELLGAGKWPVLRVGNFFTSDKWYHSNLELDDDKYCDGGDLLYAWSASFGPKIWPGPKAIYHYHIWKVLPKSELIDRDYLFYWFKWDVEQVKKAHGTGATMMHITKQAMESRAIAVPPLDEQRRIVDILNHAASIRRLRDEARAKAREIIPALFVEMFGDPVTNPKGWEISTLGAEIDGFEGGHSPKAGDEDASPFRILKLSAVTGGLFRTDEHKPAPTGYEPTAVQVVKQGDILVTRSNTAELVGAVALVRQPVQGLLLPDLIWRVVLKPATRILPDYIWAFCQVPSVRRAISQLATGTSDSMRKLSQGRLRTLPIVVPSLALQQEFAERVTEVESIRSLNDRAATAAEQMAQSLLAQVFGQAA